MVEAQPIQGGLVDGGTVRRNDEGDDDLSQVGIGLTDHRDLGHDRIAEQHFLDLAGIDVAVAGDDQVLGTILEGQKAILVERADVAVVELAAAQRLRRGSRVAPVAAHHRIAANQHLAGSSRRQRGVVGPGDDHLDHRLRGAHRGEARRCSYRGWPMSA
jgi:hypothetical protein